MREDSKFLESERSTFSRNIFDKVRRQSKEAEDDEWEDRKVSIKNKRDPDWDDGDDEEMEDEEEYYAKLDQ